MKKRMLSSLCVLALCLTLLPVTARAAGESITVGGQTLTYSDAPVSHEFGSGTATWDGSTLTLNNVNLDNANESNDPGIDYSGSSPIVIELIGSSSVSDFSTGIKSTQDITITGAGSLTVSATTYGINTDGDLRIGDEGPTVTAGVTGIGVDVYAINARGNVEISGGTVTANCKTTVTDRFLKSYGIAAGRDVIISGGTVTARSESTSETSYPLYSYCIMAEGNVILSDGTVILEGHATGKVRYNFGIDAVGATISGGEVTWDCTSQGSACAFIMTDANIGVTVDPQYGYQINVIPENGPTASYIERTENLSLYGKGSHARITTTEQDLIKITVGGYELAGSPLAPAVEEIGEGTVTWDSNTLTLENVTVESKDSSGIKYDGDNTITIKLVGDNSVTGKYSGIVITNLVICGDGQLTAEGEIAGIRVGSYYGATGTITFSGGTVNASTQTPEGKGIYAFDNSAITISGGVVNANTQATGSQGIYVGDGSTITISGGTVTANTTGESSHGICAGNNGTITISGGTVTANTKGVSSYGIYVGDSGTLDIAGGKVTVDTQDENGHGICVGNRGKLDITDGTVIVDTRRSYGIYAGDSGTLDITGGTVTVNVEDRLHDGIRGDKVNIMGGTVTSDGLYGIAVNGTGLTIGGGTITASGKWWAIGSLGSFDITVAPPENKHITVQYGADENATTTDVFTYTVRKTYGDLYFHSEVTEPTGGGETVVTAISISPGNGTEIQAGSNAQRFTARVDCTGYVDDRVTWSVSGSTNPRTTISESSNDGLLVVASDETATSLTVRATSVADPEKFSEVTITIIPYKAAITVGDVQLSGSVVEPAYAKTDAAGSVQPCEKGEATIIWDGTTLTLKGAKISGSTTGIDYSERLVLVLEGTNTVTVSDQNAYGIRNTGLHQPDLTISGSGTLTVHGPNIGIYCHNFIMESGTVTASGRNGISAGKAFTMRGGTLAVRGSEMGITTSTRGVTIEGGTLNVTTSEDSYYGIFCINNNSSLTVRGGTVTVTNSSDGEYCIYCNSVTIQGGVVTVTSTGAEGYGIYGQEALDIQGGTVTATVTGEDGYGVFSSGGTTINPQEGETIVVEMGQDASSASEAGRFTTSGKVSGTNDYLYFHSYVSTEVIPVSGVELDRSELSLYPGDTVTLTAAVKPANAANQAVTWSSSDPNVAEVDHGVVTAVGEGTAIITVITQDGGKTDTCIVTVNPKTYQITASPAGLNFTSATEGYTTAPDAQVVTVTNTGNQNVTVSLPSAANYTIAAGAGFAGGSATLAPKETAQFTVQPKAGLTVGNYDTTLTISGNNGASAETELSFVVVEAGHIHDYDTQWRSNQNSHWHTCSCGAKADMDAHSGGSATCVEKAVCAVCGAVYGELAQHNYNGQPWQFNENEHWRECKVCGQQSSKVAHIFINGICAVCGYVSGEASLEYTVHFDANGGYVNQSSAATKDGKLESLPTPTRSSYDFVGWYTAPVGGTQVTIHTVFTQSTTIYAHWAKQGSGNLGNSDENSEPTYSVSLPGKVKGGQVTANKRYAEEGETFRITVTADQGYELGTLTATDSKGRELKLEYEGSGKYSFKMPAEQVTIMVSFRETGAEPEPLPFTDVAENAWYTDAVRYVYENGVMSGTSAATFHPNGTISRQQVWMILARIAGENPANMTEAKSWAVANGISDGTNPGGAVTRQQLATLLYRYAVQSGYDVSVGESTNILSYTDAFGVAEYAIPAMQWAVGAGIITGTGDGSTLAPQGQAIRAQAAVMLMRFCEKYVNW